MVHEVVCTVHCAAPILQTVSSSELYIEAAASAAARANARRVVLVGVQALSGCERCPLVRLVRARAPLYRAMVVPQYLSSEGFMRRSTGSKLCVAGARLPPI